MRPRDLWLPLLVAALLAAWALCGCTPTEPAPAEAEGGPSGREPEAGGLSAAKGGVSADAGPGARIKTPRREAIDGGLEARDARPDGGDSGPGRGGDARPAVSTSGLPVDGFHVTLTHEATPGDDEKLLRGRGYDFEYLRSRTGFELFYRFSGDKTWNRVEVTREGPPAPWTHLFHVVEYPLAHVAESGVAYFALVDAAGSQACVLPLDTHREIDVPLECRLLPAAPAAKRLAPEKSLSITPALRYLEHCPTIGKRCLLHGSARATAKVRDPTEPPGGWHLVEIPLDREPLPPEEPAREGKVSLRRGEIRWKCGYGCDELIVEERDTTGKLVGSPRRVVPAPHVSGTDYAHTFAGGNGVLVLVAGGAGYRIALLFTAADDAIVFERPGEPGRLVRLGVDWSKGYTPVSDLAPVWRVAPDGVLRPRP